MQLIKIKKGSINISSDRKDFVQVEQTSDGMVFNFKNGIYVYLTDTAMPLEVKERIKAADRFENGNVLIDLSNYKQPASLELLDK